MDLPVRLIPHGKIQPQLFVYDTLVVREGVKAFFAVVGAHSAFAEAAEAHFAGGQVYDGVIDASAAEAAPGSDFPGGFFVFRKDVESQGMGKGIDPADGFLQGVIGQYGKHRTEDFLLHDGILESDIVHHGGFDPEALAVMAASVEGLVRIDQF